MSTTISGYEFDYPFEPTKVDYLIPGDYIAVLHREGFAVFQVIWVEPNGVSKILTLKRGHNIIQILNGRDNLMARVVHW